LLASINDPEEWRRDEADGREIFEIVREKPRRNGLPLNTDRADRAGVDYGGFPAASV
jgi:hypothetical protein